MAARRLHMTVNSGLLTGGNVETRRELVLKARLNLQNGLSSISDR